MEKYGLKTIQHIENRKLFTEVHPPPSVTKLILLHTVVVLHFTHHKKRHDWSRGGGGGRCRNDQKHFIIKTY